MEIKPGETVAIIGSSGSGKSTIVNLLLRFYDINRGQVFLSCHYFPYIFKTDKRKYLDGAQISKIELSLVLNKNSLNASFFFSPERSLCFRVMKIIGMSLLY